MSRHQIVQQFQHLSKHVAHHAPVSPLGACCSPAHVSPAVGACYSCCDCLLVYTFKFSSSFGCLHFSSSIGTLLVYTFKSSSSFGFLHLSSPIGHGTGSTTNLNGSFSFVLNILLSPSRLTSLVLGESKSNRDPSSLHRTAQTLNVISMLTNVLRSLGLPHL
jgi:hypothetical protein